MNYAKIDEFEYVNGEGIGTSLFVQGCKFGCRNCFNKETWNFSDGKEWTPDIQKWFLDISDKVHVMRISLLGGECLADENIKEIFDLVIQIRKRFGDTKKIWLYTGYTWEQLTSNNKQQRQEYIDTILSNIDVLIDGKYIDEQRDLTLKFRGSKNQRVINVKESLSKGEVVLWSK